jgi:Tetracyclin repressor-like, C-terminal domain
VAKCAREDYEARLRATHTAYVRFAIDDAALLKLMFAGKRREQAGALHEAADRAFSVPLELIEEGHANSVLEPCDPERIGPLLFATTHGIAALVTAGSAPEPVDNLVADAIGRFLHGPRIPA